MNPGGLPKNSKNVNKRGCMQRFTIERSNRLSAGRRHSDNLVHAQSVPSLPATSDCPRPFAHVVGRLGAHFPSLGLLLTVSLSPRTARHSNHLEWVEPESVVAPPPLASDGGESNFNCAAACRTAC